MADEQYEPATEVRNNLHAWDLLPGDRILGTDLVVVEQHFAGSGTVGSDAERQRYAVALRRPDGTVTQMPMVGDSRTSVIRPLLQVTPEVVPLVSEPIASASPSAPQARTAADLSAYMRPAEVSSLIDWVASEWGFDHVRIGHAASQGAYVLRWSDGGERVVCEDETGRWQTVADRSEGYVAVVGCEALDEAQMYAKAHGFAGLKILGIGGRASAKFELVSTSGEKAEVKASEYGVEPGSAKLDTVTLDDVEFQM